MIPESVVIETAESIEMWCWLLRDRSQEERVSKVKERLAALLELIELKQELNRIYEVCQ